MPFKQMENVSNFIKACRKIGVPEYALFTTPDLYDGKSVVNVTNGLVALGSKAQSIPGYSGPSLGASDNTEKVGSYTKGVKKSKWKIGSGGGGMSKMMMGSAGVMQKTQAGFHDISNGANYSGKSVGGRTKMGDGSSSVMDRTQNSYHDISNGAKHSGASVGGATLLSQGSSNTMERSSNQNFRDITRGAEKPAKPKPKPKPRPPPKPSRPKPFKTAAWDYVAAEGDELNMSAGDKITILEAVDDDWGKGENQRTGEVGMYPMNYVE